MDEFNTFNIYGKIFIGYNKRKDVCRRVYFNGIKTDYEVTIDGDVYNIKRKRKLIPVKIAGHYKVLIYYRDINNNMTRKLVFVHRLVATAFIPNPKNKKEVHHIDVNPENNSVSNLMWVTNKEHNEIHQKLGKFEKSARRGEDNNFTQTTTDTILKICDEFRKNKLTPPQIAKKYGVSRKSVTLLLYKKRWTHITKDMDFSMYTKLRKVSPEAKEKALYLIKNTNMNLLDISRMTGISHTYVSRLNRILNIRKKNLIVKRSTTRERLS